MKRDKADGRSFPRTRTPPGVGVGGRAAPVAHRGRQKFEGSGWETPRRYVCSYSRRQPFAKAAMASSRVAA